MASTLSNGAAVREHGHLHGAATVIQHQAKTINDINDNHQKAHQEVQQQFKKLTEAMKKRDENES